MLFRSPDDEHGYKVGPDRPPLHTRFQKSKSGNPGGRSKKSLQGLLADALNQLGSRLGRVITPAV